MEVSVLNSLHLQNHSQKTMTKNIVSASYHQLQDKKKIHRIYQQSYKKLKKAKEAKAVINREKERIKKQRYRLRLTAKATSMSSPTNYATPMKSVNNVMNTEFMREYCKSVERSYELKKETMVRLLMFLVASMRSIESSLNLLIFSNRKKFMTAEKIVRKDDEQTEQELRLQDILNPTVGCKRSREDDDGKHKSGTPIARKRVRVIYPMHVDHPEPTAAFIPPSPAVASTWFNGTAPAPINSCKIPYHPVRHPKLQTPSCT